MGHALHSFYANKSQPYPAGGLLDLRGGGGLDVQRDAADPQDAAKRSRTTTPRLSLLMNYLDGIKGTVFRQTQFAEFELRMHEKAERGEPLTGDTFTQLYGDILKEYYGHDRASAGSTTCTPWSGPTSRISTTTSTCTSTPRRSRRRRRWPRRSWAASRGRAEVSRFHLRRRLGLSDRRAQEGGSGHDDARAVPQDHGRDEPHHGRDRDDPCPPGRISDVAGDGMDDVRKSVISVVLDGDPGGIMISIKRIPRYIIGVILILLGFIALVTPLTPGSWLILVGLELLGLRILLQDKLLAWAQARPNSRLARIIRRIVRVRRRDAPTCQGGAQEPHA